MYRTEKIFFMVLVIKVSVLFIILLFINFNFKNDIKKINNPYRQTAKVFYRPI